MENQTIRDENLEFYDSEVVKKFELTKEVIENAQRIIDSDKDTIPEFWKEKYVKESVKNWDKFYKRNNTNFFLDRHWIDKEFRELVSQKKGSSGESLKENSDKVSRYPLLIEFGCGVGNSLIPLLEISDSLHCIGFDCSVRAISLLQGRWSEALGGDSKKREGASKYPLTKCKNREYCPFNSLCECSRLQGFVFDILQSDIPTSICSEESADFGLLVFVLSAIHPKYHQTVILRCARSIRPGGIVLFRDYGRYDMAQLRFAKSSKSKITENFYVRYDGTFAYYFTAQEVERLFTNAGFKVISNNYCLREVVNRKTQVSMQRVWIQGKFVKE
ncbi:Methyltransferase-like protein [Cryptosporidium felis]|nr:Methyltransferase-like protein [Cryptosporidium felis]